MDPANQVEGLPVFKETSMNESVVVSGAVPGGQGGLHWGLQGLRAGLVAIMAVVGLAQAAADPPGRAGRLNHIQGTVSFSPAGTDDWVEARTTRPLTSGDRVWADRGARTELSIGSAVLRADGETSLSILELDDDNAQFELGRGTLAVHVRDVEGGERLEISTPDLALVIDRPGDYRIQVDPVRNTTEVILRRGSATAHDEAGRHRLEAPLHARFQDGRLTWEDPDLPWRDGFDRWVESRIERERSRAAGRYLSPDMVGYEDLDDYGDWREEPGYGQVWAPRITITGWAPYRHGHWAWIAPWGWTWVDDAPWGFAPFHYGRWAQVRSRWIWVPGPVVRRPCYAPALVAFVGGAGWNLSASSGPAVAWFPLGPREAYRPVYRASEGYYSRINRTILVEREILHREGPRDYQNRRIPGAVTALTQRAFVEGRPVHREALRFSGRDLEQAPVDATMPALAPIANSRVGREARREAPPRFERERPVFTTRRPPPPPVDRDELAERFSRSGQGVQDAGPPRVNQPGPRESRQEQRIRVLPAPGPAESGPGPSGPSKAHQRAEDRSQDRIRDFQESRPSIAPDGERRGSERFRPPPQRQQPTPPMPETAPAPPLPSRIQRMEEIRRPVDPREPPRGPETRPVPDIRRERPAPPPESQFRPERHNPRQAWGNSSDQGNHESRAGPQENRTEARIPQRARIETSQAPLPESGLQRREVPRDQREPQERFQRNRPPGQFEER